MTRSNLVKLPAALVGLILLITATSVIAKPRLEHAASIAELTMISEGARLPGIIYQAQGAGPHPTAVFLHGYPGNEKSLDVAQAVRARGWNAVFFHYRGAWGAEGEFSFLNAEADVQAVLTFLRTPETAANYRIDAEQIALVGHSMGGHMAIAGMLGNPHVTCAVSYDGANLGANGVGLFSDAEGEALWRDYTDTLFMLNGWNGEKAVAQIKAHGAKLDLVPRLDKLNGRPIMILSANSVVIPVAQHITPIVEAVRKIDETLMTLHEIEDDHSFSNHRAAVIDLTYQFLEKRCFK